MERNTLASNNNPGIRLPVLDDREPCGFEEAMVSMDSFFAACDRCHRYSIPKDEALERLQNYESLDAIAFNAARTHFRFVPSVDHSH